MLFLVVVVITVVCPSLVVCLSDICVGFVDGWGLFLLELFRLGAADVIIVT